MPLDPIELAWVRFVAMRDQLLAARDEENTDREAFVLPPVSGSTPDAIDLRDGAWDPSYTGTWRDRRR